MLTGRKRGGTTKRRFVNSHYPVRCRMDTCTVFLSLILTIQYPTSPTSFLVLAVVALL
jgi:hypothetical protein